VGFIGGTIGYRLLRRLSPGTTGNNDYTAYEGKSKVEVLFGPEVWNELRGKVVVDFGCEGGLESIDLAKHGVKKVIGVDLYEDTLAEARRRAEEAGVADRCVFTRDPAEKVDVVMTLDAFEHFADPAGMLDVMGKLLKDDGFILACFGPTWYHPLGGHGFSIFPWAHLVFTEKAIMRWYGDFSREKPTRFSEVRGGLNQMTIGRFERIVAASDFRFESFKAVPIRKLKPLQNRLTREFTTAVVRCKLVRRQAPANLDKKPSQVT
jgi:SAM-dependent methyltransferase